MLQKHKLLLIFSTLVLVFVLPAFITNLNFLENHTRNVIIGVVLLMLFILAFFLTTQSIIVYARNRNDKTSRNVVLIGIMVILIPIIAYLILAILAGLSLQE